MIRTTDNKLIIEMDTRCPGDDLQSLQEDIIGAIQFFNYKDFGYSDGCPFMVLLDLLKATLPTYYQQRQMLEFTEMANDPEISKTDIVEWFTTQKELLIKETAQQ